MSSKSAAEIKSASARQSLRMYAYCAVARRLFSGMGTIPARIAPQNAIGNSTVSSNKRTMRLSCRSPSVLITSSKSISRDLQIAIAQFAGRIDKRALGTKTARNIEVDEIGGGVVRSPLGRVVSFCHYSIRSRI